MDIKPLMPHTSLVSAMDRVADFFEIFDDQRRNSSRVDFLVRAQHNRKTKDDALDCIKWYCLRWRIEDWHRVLKSGCRVEALAHKTAERLKRAIAINLVIAWRIMLMTLLGRETPKLSHEVLQAYAKKKH